MQMAKVNAKRLSQVSTSSAFDSCLDFDSKDDLKDKEVEELKARITQMEKSMRWWNQCANNWRLKWTDVRNERNRLKDECRSIKNKLEDFENKYSTLENEFQRIQLQTITESVSEQDCSRIVVNNRINDCTSIPIPRQIDNPLNNGDITHQSTLEDPEVPSFNSVVENSNAMRTNIPSNADVSTDTSDLKTDSSAYNCEATDCGRLSDLKLAHKQLKKVLQDKCVELSNALRKVDAYENEIKKLRLRTDELKKELVVAEDHADNASNTIRKLQRNNDKLQEQMNDFREGLQSNARRDESRQLNVDAIEQ